MIGADRSARCGRARARVPAGPGPSGTIGVMTPLLALGVSVLLESYRPDALTGVGVLLAVAGNVLMLRRKKAAT